VICVAAVSGSCVLTAQVSSWCYLCSLRPGTRPLRGRALMLKRTPVGHVGLTAVVAGNRRQVVRHRRHVLG
jgi:hypothetical protein